MNKIARRMADIQPFHVMEILKRAHQLEAAGRDIIHLEVGEPDFPTPPTIVEAARDFLAGGHVHYTPALGLTALRESSKKIAVFFLFVVILVTSIGTLMYMIEGTQPDSQFNNIPNSIYWAIVTMTTVGYGDITPVTGFGKFLSACVMLIGYTIIAVPTGIVSASMMKDYKRRRDKECPHCHRSGHEDNAGFCKYCGSSLNPKDEMQVKPEDEAKDNT